MNRSGERHDAELGCGPYDPALHAPGTRGASGRCSWTENCPAPPSWTTTVTTTTRSPCYALCDDHHPRVHQYFTATSTAPEDEVGHLLRAWATGFAARCRAHPTHAEDPARVGDLRLGRRGLERDECAAFLRTWRGQLVRIDTDGTFTLPTLQACPPELHLIGRSENATALHTEYLIQIGAIAELIDDHGWVPGELAFEQGEWDTLGYRDGRVQLAVEAKARADASDPDGLARLEASLVRLSADPGHRAPPNHDRKWRALVTFVEEGSVDVLLVASGARRWLRATRRPDGTTQIEPRP